MRKVVRLTPSMRPRVVRHGDYTATVVKEEPSPWGPCTAWEITRNGVVVGKMFQGGGGYGERPHCSMTALVWSGRFPMDSSDPKSPNYGMCFDTGPRDSREGALAEFAQRADRLIAWREKQGRA